MLKKIFRLKELEVKKVLLKWEPFFSYWIVINYMKNYSNNNKFWIVISSDSVNNNVTRVFFRRRFYDLIKNISSNSGYDMVFVVKKKTKLDKKDLTVINNFDNDINFLIKKVLDFKK